MKIEVLYPEVANLYGEQSNIEYLIRSCPEAETVSTGLRETPKFLSEHVDLVYMGTMTEHAQIEVIKAFLPFKEALWDSIEHGTAFLITGNALEVFGKHIEDVEGETVRCLGLFDFHTTRDMLHRYNSLYIGKYEDLDVVGYKSQFTQSFYDKDYTPMFQTERGTGFNPEIKSEGLHYRNFMATYVIGPLFILNPQLMVRIMEELGVSGITPAFEKQAMEAYEARLNEYRDPSLSFIY